MTMKPIIKKGQVRVDDVEPVRPRRGHPKVARLLSVDGQVRGIEFRCSCGDVTVLELEYGQVAAAPATEVEALPEENQS